MVAHAFNTSTWEAEARRLLGIPGQPDQKIHEFKGEKIQRNLQV